MDKYSISGLFLIASIFLFATAALGDSRVDANGILIEPTFFCKTLGYLSLLISLVIAVYSYVKDKIIKK